jgi:shikimate dehydrogenase
MKNYGLIGYPLSHSFSKKYFAEKYVKEGITNCFYDLFPLENITQFPQLLTQVNNLVGLNVTIPYKEKILPFLDELAPDAAAIGAVNTIKIINGKLKGFNTDVYGFGQSLSLIIHGKYTKETKLQALILGTGGASKAVFYALKQMGIKTKFVSRNPNAGQLSYDDLTEKIMLSHQIIVNTTPLGMSPKIDSFPNIPYQYLIKNHLLYDLVYNPAISAFLQKGLEQETTIKNGLEMLHLQAEKSWEIWNF